MVSLEYVKTDQIQHMWEIWQTKIKCDIFDQIKKHKRKTKNWPK